MKSFLKLSLLFALIIIGRYMQSVQPGATGIQRKPPLVLFAPANVNITQYANYTDTTPARVIPASQPKRTVATWY